VMTKFLTFLSQPTIAPTLSLPTLAPTTSATQAPNEALYARVTTVQGSLNLRATATSQGMILRTIPQYALIPILDKGDTWCKTTYNGYTGFVMTKFLTFVSQPAQQPTLAPTPTPAPQATAEPALRYAQVTTVQGSLNLRASAGKNGTVLCTIPQYEIIPIYQAGSVWCQTSYGGFNGYVMTSFLTFASQPAATQQPQATLQPTQAPAASSTAQVTTEKGSLNLRLAPGSAKVLRTIPQYAYVTVLQKGSEWCQVHYAGSTGYVMTKFLTFLAASPTQAPTQTATASPTPVPEATLIPATQAPATQAPTTLPSIQSGQQARITTPTGSLNLRSEPDGDAAVLRTIPQQEIVIVTEYGKTWSKVVYSGTTGYVMSQYLTPLGSVQAPTQAPTAAPTKSPVGTIIGYAQVTTASGSLNLRIGPWDGAAILTTIPQYATVPVYSKGTTWCQVTYNGTTGYVMTKFLTFQNSQSPTAAPTAVPQATQTPADTPKPSVNYDAMRDESLKKLSTLVLSQVKPQSGAKLALYAGCSEEATLLDNMLKDDYVIITHVGDTWCAVQYEGQSGYCLRKYLEFELYE